MISLCSEHAGPGQTGEPELLWALLVPPGRTALVLCDHGHYVLIRGAVIPPLFYQAALSQVPVVQEAPAA